MSVEVVDMNIKQTLKKKPLKRSTYFVLVAVLACVVSGALTFLTQQPQWKTSFSYLYLPENSDPVEASGNKNNAFLPQFSSGEPITAQVEILHSAKFLEEVRLGLEKAGIHGWTQDRIEKSLTVSTPESSHLINIEVQTPQKQATHQIALLLNKTYIDYLNDLQKQVVLKEKSFVENSLKYTRKKLDEGDNAIRQRLATDPQMQLAPFINDPGFGEKTLAQSYSDLSLKLKDVEAEISLEDTQYKHYQSLLNKDEKTLIEGVILGEDPILEKITDKLAAAETDANILSIKYTPDASEMSETNGRIQSLQHQLDVQRQKILGGARPVIRDSLRKGFVEQMITSKIKLQAATRTYKQLKSQQDELLANISQVSGTVGDYNAWTLEKSILESAKNNLEKRLEDLNYQLTTLSSSVKLFREVPQEPALVQSPQHVTILFLSAFSGLFLMLGAVPFAIDYRNSLIPHRSILSILNDLLKTKEQQVVMMLPINATGHLNASAHLGGLLNQFGREALVMDIDLSRRMLSRKIPLDHPYGVFEHLLAPDMKKPYQDPLSGAKVLPLEASLDADRLVEFSQVIQRMPRLWSRWSNSVIILDISQWHEAYHQLLPYISHVVFYVPHAHQSNVFNALLPKVFKGKYRVPVSLVEI